MAAEREARRRNPLWRQTPEPACTMAPAESVCTASPEQKVCAAETAGAAETEVADPAEDPDRHTRRHSITRRNSIQEENEAIWRMRPAETGGGGEWGARIAPKRAAKPGMISLGVLAPRDESASQKSLLCRGTR